MFTIPTPIKQKVAELEDLVEKHPCYLPLTEVAAFLGANAEGLRSCIESGKCPFGIAWQKTIRGNKAFKIPTATFYFWYMNFRGYDLVQ